MEAKKPAKKNAEPKKNAKPKPTQPKPTPKMIKGALDKYMITKAKVTALKAEVLTLKAKQAQMRSRPSSTASLSETNLRDSLKKAESGLQNADRERQALQQDLDGLSPV